MVLGLSTAPLQPRQQIFRCVGFAFKMYLTHYWQNNPKAYVAALRNNYANSHQYEQLQQQLRLLKTQDEIQLTNETLLYPYPTSFCNQLWVLTKTAWIVNTRDGKTLLARIGGTLLFAVLLGVMFHQPEHDIRHVYKFGSVIGLYVCAMLFYAIAGLERLSSERILYWRESAWKAYSLEAYLCAGYFTEVTASYM